MKFIINIFFAASILFVNTCFGQKLAVNHYVAKWEVIDIHHVSNETVDNPFTQNINAEFVHESGIKKIVPLVYDGSRGWLLRFSASKQGEWYYTIDTNITSFVNPKGTIKVTVNPDQSNHGAMVVSKNNPQAFAYEDGSPYFLIGYEFDWLFALDYDNENGLPKSEHILSLIKENGFNHIVMNVYAHDVSWTKDKKLLKHPEHEFGGRQDIFPFLGSNEKPDFSALNVKFFQKLDRTVALLHDKRLVSHLMIYVWNKMVNWPPMNSAADNMYFDYVVKRYSAFPNIVWDISKEALFYGRADEAYIKNRIERLRKLNYFNRLVTVHDYKYCSKYPEQVDFISSQNWGHDIYNLMLKVRQRFNNKPIYNIEHGGYEQSPYEVFPGDYTDPEILLRRNWMIIFAGVYSTYYWQATSWNAIIYNPFQQPDNVIKPRFDYFKAMSHFFTQFDFTRFKPNPGKNGSGYNLSNKQGTHLIYVPKENFQMSRGNWYLYPKNDVKRDYQWFNTLTGELTNPAPINKGMLFISPWRGQADAILVSKIIH